jgi:zinc transport system substrate-binding protein
MEGVGEPLLLLRGAASPHAFALRPSDAKAIQAADVVFWIGDGLETFLAKPLGALGPRTRIVALAAAPGVKRLALRPGGAHDAAHAYEPAGPDARGLDAHIWLDPENARHIARYASLVLSEVDSPNAPRYAANTQDIELRLDALTTTLQARLGAVRGHPYVVLHDAYQYFERRFAIAPIATFAAIPSQPGARRLRDLRRTILESGTVCVFGGPPSSPTLLTTVVAGTPARAGILDPLGLNLEPGPDAYFVLMRNLAASLSDCLAKG